MQNFLKHSKNKKYIYLCHPDFMCNVNKRIIYKVFQNKNNFIFLKNFLFYL